MQCNKLLEGHVLTDLQNFLCTIIIIIITVAKSTILYIMVDNANHQPDFSTGIAITKLTP